ncbi:MAG: hypothetical protein KY476_01440 [Planctomycetes bacterium]|nr:hypothetical protein [Planctomycetota bacterium]
MLRRMAWAAVFVGTMLSLPARASDAESAPEALLPAESVLYLRFDGMAGQRTAYAKTILAELVDDQFGPLIEDLTRRIGDALGPGLLSERLLEGVEPQQLLSLQVALKQLPRLFECLDQNGAALGVEVISTTPPRFQATLVLPQGGEPENRSAIFGGLRLVATLSEADLVEAKHGDRSLLVFDAREPVKFAAWQEGPHVVVTFGTEDVEHTLALARGERPILTSNATFAALDGFNGYPSIGRGFFDLERVAALASAAFPPVADALEQVGLRDLRNVRFHLGFEDRLVRTTLLLEAPEQRRGLLALLAPPSALDPAQLPPLPPDAGFVAATAIELGGTYDALVASFDGVWKVFAPFDESPLPAALDEMKRVLGVDLRHDVLATLDSPVVTFSSPGEGPFSFGLAIRTKDPERLAKSLETVARSLGASFGGVVEVRTREYAGVSVNSIRFTEGVPFLPSYAIHQGWLVAGIYPQTVQGFVYRMQEEVPSGRTPGRWELPEIAKSSIADALQGREGSRLTGLSVNDPRPGAKAILAIAPFFVQAVTQFSGGTDFDISLVPNAHTVIEALHESVTVVIDDGKTIRYEGYAAFPLPLPPAGLEMYTPFLLFGILGFGF